ncbi:serine/threonine kinase [Naegleria gruberi]|uniref:cyclin-dependent kinase n=1 Tax=Naegleria gruberi TaxID=5762 RepID=D2UXS0_NAEGR|nr:serine/threonine kinase [Naegleria gruberi]EFC50677.1 serine/threonine kinase [Naegleria gruberi]|eukprot:XP_002683421.1 serine/threonine kinase [Naegleria gruberi strain NEG-M]
MDQSDTSSIDDSTSQFQSFNYAKIEPLGEGTYGEVYKSMGPNKQLVALKCIKLDQLNEGVPCTAIREIAILKELKHPNVVRLVDLVHSMDQLTLVFEYCNYGDLKAYINNVAGDGKGLPSRQVKNFMRQMLKGIEYCHMQSVLHRDLKPQNILVNAFSSNSSSRQSTNPETGNIELKLGDFGLARSFGIPVRKLSHEVVTLWYRSIDILLGSQSYGFGVDIWSLGCIFAEMVTGKPLFTGKDELSQLASIISKTGLPISNEWPDLKQLPNYDIMMNKIAKKISIPSQGRISKEQFSSDILHKKLDSHGVDLLYRMLEYDPTKRPSATECLKHAYFSTN